MSEALLKQILQEVTGLKSDINELKTDMQSVKVDIAGLKADVSGLKEDVASIKQEQIKMNERISRLETRQLAIYEQTGNLTTYHTETLARIDRLQTDVEFTYHKTAQHDLQLNRLEHFVPPNH